MYFSPTQHSTILLVFFIKKSENRCTELEFQGTPMKIKYLTRYFLLVLGKDEGWVWKTLLEDCLEL